MSDEWSWRTHRSSRWGFAPAAVLISLAGCGAEGAQDADVSVVRVAAQPCRTPNRALGLGVVLDEDVVATAAHTVDDDLR
ncbi:MAG: hypothetical protein ACR2HQ_14195, partial [Ilumatobacteraceae bacterium]